MTTSDTKSKTLAVKRKISGTLRLPGDKSISHRALLFNALACGQAKLTGLSTGGDVASTRKCLEQLGCQFEQLSDDTLLVNSSAGLKQASESLDCGNSGTTTRLMIGALAGLNIPATLIGDESLSKRPMKRVMAPLLEMGAILKSNEGRLPLEICSTSDTLKGLQYQLPVASAQVKSAVLIAGLYLPATETHSVTDPFDTRDHTERMLEAMGIAISRENKTLVIKGRQSNLQATDITVPGDISSAAFLAVATAILPGSKLRLEHVSLNPTRTPLLELLKQVGVDVQIEQTAISVGEPIGNITLTAPENLQGDLTITPEMVTGLIDEIPILTILGLLTNGKMTLQGAEELRYKESDRLGSLIAYLKQLGVDYTEAPDGFSFEGNSKFSFSESIADLVFETHHDHRLVMSLEILSLRSPHPLNIKGKEWVQISYPSFYDHLSQLLQAD